MLHVRAIRWRAVGKLVRQATEADGARCCMLSTQSTLKLNNCNHMKYKDDEIKRMLQEYFREVHVINWERFSDEEYSGYIEQGHFRVIENFRQIKDAPTEDVVFFINEVVGNYHVFLIRQFRLVEVHQDHQFRWCLTCHDMGEKSPYLDSVGAGDSSAGSSPF